MDLVGCINIYIIRRSQNLEILVFNTRIYNLISIPQITRFLLEDLIISRKTGRCSGSAKPKRRNS